MQRLRQPAGRSAPPDSRPGKTEKDAKGGARRPRAPKAEEDYVAPAPKKKSGCYVATAVYGSYDCPQVWTLRRFRDQQLAASLPGQAFIRLYYAVSPALVRWFGETAWFKALWKAPLDRLVRRLREKGVEDTPYQDQDW